MSQKGKFSAIEGDNYFERNKNKLVCSDDDPIIQAIAQLELIPKNILEIGCSNGWRLNLLNKIYKSDCSAAVIQNFQHMQGPGGHAIIWQAIKYFKENNYKYFELGWQYYGNQLLDYPSEKVKMISYFKRGFGGSSYPLYRGIKYYDKSLLKLDILKNADLYCG